jgi:MFS family permease
MDGASVNESPGGRTAHDPYLALRVRDFRFYLCGSVVAFLGIQMQTLAVEWEVYSRTGQYLSLGWVGLLSFAPVALLALPAGHLADCFERRRIVIFANLSMVAASIGLAAVVLGHGPTWLIYCLVGLAATGRAIQQPARAALLPQIVPPRAFSNAVTWGGGGFQLASVLGPAMGGLVIGLMHSTAPAFVLAAGGTGTFALLAFLLTRRPAARDFEAPTLSSLGEGIRFIWRTRIILATISLDLFAVLLGGAVGLLPVYAKDILKIGATGLGWMRAMPFLGALLTSLILAHRRPMQKAGRALLWSVAGFGVATIVFGFSRSVTLSMAMLLLTGAFDMVSVVIRHTLVQTLTPDEMRGRVSAVNGVFIGASNDLGAFESAAAAQLIGPTGSVVFGGVGTLVVVGLVALLSSGMRRYGRLDQEAVAPEPTRQALPVGAAEGTAAERVIRGEAEGTREH